VPVFSQLAAVWVLENVITLVSTPDQQEVWSYLRAPITRARMKSARLRGKAFNAPLHKPIKRLRGSRPTKAQIKFAVEQGIIDLALGEFEEE